MNRLLRIANLELVKKQCANIYSKDIHPVIRSLSNNDCKKIIKLLCHKCNKDEDEISDFIDNYTDADMPTLVDIIKPNSMYIFGEDIFAKVMNQITENKEEAEKIIDDSIAFDIITRMKLYNTEKMFNDLQNTAEEPNEELDREEKLNQLVDEYSDLLTKQIYQRLKDKIEILTEDIVMEVTSKTRIPEYEIYRIMSMSNGISDIIDILGKMLDNNYLRRIIGVDLIPYIREESKKILRKEKIINIHMIEKVTKSVLNSIMYSLAVSIQMQALKIYESNTAKILPFKRK